MLLHDNAPPHSATRARQFLAQEMVTVLDHPPYDPDLAPVDFFLLPRVKAVIKGVRFAEVNAIRKQIKQNIKIIFLYCPSK